MSTLLAICLGNILLLKVLFSYKMRWKLHNCGVLKCVRSGSVTTSCGFVKTFSLASRSVCRNAGRRLFWSFKLDTERELMSYPACCILWWGRWFVFGRCPFQISAGPSAIQKVVVCGFCQSINANTGLGLQIEPPLFVSNLLFKGKGKSHPVSCPSR